MKIVNNVEGVKKLKEKKIISEGKEFDEIEDK